MRAYNIARIICGCVFVVMVGVLMVYCLVRWKKKPPLPLQQCTATTYPTSVRKPSYPVTEKGETGANLGTKDGGPVVLTSTVAGLTAAATVSTVGLNDSGGGASGNTGSNSGGGGENGGGDDCGGGCGGSCGGCGGCGGCGCD